MSDLKELIAEVETAEANGAQFTCTYSDTRTATRTPSSTARARWDGAIESALLEYNGDRKRATSMVARRRPELRAALIREANVAKPAAKPAAKPKSSASQAFREQVEALVADGMSKRDAVRQLSLAMGLSSQPVEPNYFRDGKQRYKS